MPNAQSISMKGNARARQTITVSILSISANLLLNLLFSLLRLPSGKPLNLFVWNFMA
jgi:hypothetical protein